MSASRISLAITAVCCRSFPRWSISAPAVTLDRRNAITEFGSSGNDRVMYVHLPYESLLRCCSFCYWSHLPISTKGVICRSTFSERISISFKFFFFFSPVYFLLREWWVRQRAFSLPCLDAVVTVQVEPCSLVVSLSRDDFSLSSQKQVQEGISLL